MRRDDLAGDYLCPSTCVRSQGLARFARHFAQRVRDPFAPTLRCWPGGLPAVELAALFALLALVPASRAFPGSRPANDSAFGPSLGRALGQAGQVSLMIGRPTVLDPLPPRAYEPAEIRQNPNPHCVENHPRSAVPQGPGPVLPIGDCGPPAEPARPGSARPVFGSWPAPSPKRT